MKEKLINIGIGVLIGAIITATGFTIFINAKGVGKRPDFGDRPQMKQMQDKDGNKKTPPELPNGKEQKNNDDSSASTQETQKTESNS